MRVTLMVTCLNEAPADQLAFGTESLFLPGSDPELVRVIDELFAGEDAPSLALTEKDA